jgi:hypothetical protein
MISDRETDAHLAGVLEILKQKFEGGEKPALLFAVYHCLLLKRPLPEWLRLAFLDTYEAHARFEIRSWDEVFGPPVPKGTQLLTEKKRRLVIERVWELKRENPKTAIDRGLFEKIGEEQGMSGSAAEGLYYDERSQWLREINEDMSGRFFGILRKSKNSPL